MFWYDIWADHGSRGKSRTSHQLSRSDMITARVEKQGYEYRYTMIQLALDNQIMFLLYAYQTLLHYWHLGGISP
jgi:hypothetical protein